MEVSTELLVADLAQKLRRGLIDPHGPNCEDDIRSAVMLAENPNEHLEMALALIDSCQKVLASYLPPDGITKDECINQLLGLLDGPRSRAVLPIDKPQPGA